MKRNWLMIGIGFFLSFPGGISQEDQPVEKKSNEKKAYVCNCEKGKGCDCHASATQPGQCPCKKEMVEGKIRKIATKLACACGCICTGKRDCGCGMKSDKTGKCPCGKELEAP